MKRRTRDDYTTRPHRNMDGAKRKDRDTHRQGHGKLYNVVMMRRSETNQKRMNKKAREECTPTYTLASTHIHP